MPMKFLNGVVALLLALATTAMGLFFMGSEAQYDQLLKHIWPTLALRATFAGSVGLVGAGVWWGINWLLLKAEFIKTIDLRETARLLTASVLCGSLVGAALFCFL